MRRRKRKHLDKRTKGQRNHLGGEVLEPRILLSATWLDGTDMDDDFDGEAGTDVADYPDIFQVDAPFLAGEPSEAEPAPELPELMQIEVAGKPDSGAVPEQPPEAASTEPTGGLQAGVTGDEPGTAPDAAADVPSADPDPAGVSGADAHGAADSTIGTAAQHAPEPAEDQLNIVLVDSTLEDAEVLIESATEDAAVIQYDGASESMVDVLARVEDLAEDEGKKIDSLSILSHGSGGEFDLGTETITSDMTEDQLAAWQSLADDFSEDANVYLYGCNVVDGSGEGQQLLDTLAEITGTDVFGSTDSTGAGGDWELEAASAGDQDELEHGLDTHLDEAQVLAYEYALADYNETSWSGTQTYTDGPISFTLSVTGGGSIDWSYDGASDTLTISDTTVTSASTSITITDNNGGLNVG
ncbi:MAG: DUF4347 domain-containing protein, partial [Planctomycetota bacterium]